MWALEECTTKNGCQWAVSGSHRLIVHRRFRRKELSVVGAEFVPKEPVVWDLSAAVPLEKKAGSSVLIHSAVVHYSEDNRSEDTRHAYSIHVIDGKPGVIYPKDN
jgi:phytanoyl-CoA hydroxylase